MEPLATKKDLQALQESLARIEEGQQMLVNALPTLDVALRDERVMENAKRRRDLFKSEGKRMHNGGD